MKKFAAFFTAAVLIAVAASAFAATNPFMDVPMNSWAYDAVAQLASRGILSGYPDGLYRGRQPMTRYEAASMLARSLALVDMTKASKQDVDMLKRLVVEFKDELDALGVRADALDKDMELMKSRLGGWRISGRIRFDVEHRTRSNALAEFYDDDGKPTGTFGGNSIGNLGLGDARINIDRFFGEDDKAFFRLQIRGSNNNDGSIDSDAREWNYAYFYATVPFLFDSFLTVGWTGDDNVDRRFGFEPDITERYGNWGWFNDERKPMIMLQKSFEYGNFYGFVSHPNLAPGRAWDLEAGEWYYSDTSYDGWEVLANFDFNMNEQFSFGIGGHYFKTDDWRINYIGEEDDSTRAALNSAFTGWFGVDFNFTQGASLHGIVYFQSKSSDEENCWNKNANAWRIGLDLKQELLGFTSFYAEYGRVGQGFWAPMGIVNNMLVVGDYDYFDPDDAFGSINSESASFWKLGATQQWTDNVHTWLFFADAKGKYDGADAGMRQYGVGIDYVYNPYTIFSLNYMRWEGTGNWNERNYSRVRFTTEVSF